MSDISFNSAMTFLDSCSAGDKRALNKFFRDHCAKSFNEKISVKDAEIYVNSYIQITNSLYNLAIENWYSLEKPDFDNCVFSEYPKIDDNLKKKWIQNAHFKVFR